MEFKIFGSKYFIRLDKGEEIVETLKRFCKEQEITLGSITGLGAVNKATIGLFKTGVKKYSSVELRGDHEITSLIGNISTMDGEIYVHMHINLSNEEYKTYGGHLTSGLVSVTSEIIIDAVEGSVGRKFSEEVGINLYKFD